MYRTIPIVVIDPLGAAGNYGYPGSQGFKDAVCHWTN
jgi:hypothetical protein